MANIYSRSSNSNLYTMFSEGASGIVTASPGSLRVISAINTATADRYLMIFDKSTLPVASERPTLVFPVYAGNGYTEIGANVLYSTGVNFATGLVWGFSTTPSAFTAGTSTDAILTLRWV